MCGYFGTKKKSGSNRYSPLNSSIDNKNNKTTLKSNHAQHTDPRLVCDNNGVVDKLFCVKCV